MSLGHGRETRPVPVPIGPRDDRALARVAAAFVVMIALGLLGRLVPAPTSSSTTTPVPSAGDPSAESRVRLATPYRNVVFFRTTEIAVRGTAEPGIDSLEVAVLLDGRRPIGQATIQVDGGRFAGVVSIIPPADRAAGIMQVLATDGFGIPLAEASFSVEAGGVVLPLGPSSLEATAGQPLLVDVLVYDDAAEIRGLLTNDGVLIAQGSVPLGPHRGNAPVPRTVGLRLDVPDQRLPRWGRLHLIAIDADGREIEHIDSNVQLSNR